MSIRVMTAVWDCATEYAKGELLVLLALADWANDEGRCHPSVPRIANKSRLTERQVYNVLKQLVADGVISIESGGGRGRLTTYQIHTQQFAGERQKAKKQARRVAAAVAENPEIVSVKLAQVSTGKNPEISDTETLKFLTGNPEISCNPPHPPLGRTVREPSEGTVKELPLPPLARGGDNHSRDVDLSPGTPVRTPAAENVHAMSWGRFRLALKQALGDAPLSHANFSGIVKGEWDFNACFRDWWLIGAATGAGPPGPPVVVTDSLHREATERGLKKYRKRIEALMREHFGGLVEIQVLQRRERA